MVHDPWPLLSSPCSRLSSLCASDGALPAAGLIQHLFTPGFELVARLPLGVLLRVRDPIANVEKEPQVFNHPRQVPIVRYLVGGLVVPDFQVLFALLSAVTLGLVDEIGAPVGIERGHALLGEIEVVRAIVEAFLRLGVGLECSLLSGGGLR